ncbi:site-specific DNA-methyltransferase [uncultured Bradyrhizobium sp.]|uniref:site-specific DNA-methyltransferase n=1 Tax=uncultured Bradyrhizobium sp. TaxID=199684 RepID=UPI0035CC6C90
MKKIDEADSIAQSADVVADNIAQLKALFPEIVTEDRIDFETLKQLLGAALDEREEKYGLSWHGKRKARQLALTPSAGTLRPSPEDSVDWGTTQNLMIEGDNLEVLKLLQKSYAAKVKFIYVDPPYNTGSDFVYPDDFRDNIKNYLELTGQLEGDRRVSSNTESSGRFHTQWLSMIYPRLRLARDLMCPDGFIAVSVDDEECKNLAHVLDSIFGEENHVATLVWDRNRKNDAKLFSVGHEYMLVYAKDRSLLREMDLKLREPKEGIDEARELFTSLRLQFSDDWIKIKESWRAHFAEIDEDDPRKKLGRFTKVGPRGPFRDDGDISWPGGGGPKYEVLHPQTKKHCKVPAGGWVYPTKEKFWAAYDSGRVVFGQDESTLPRQIRYLFEGEGQVMPSVFYSYAQTATMNFVQLMGERVFENPKNWNDIARLIRYFTSDNDIILDFFAGSGTTGHATMAQNAVDLGKRRFILVQLPEPILADNKDQTIGFNFLTKLGRPTNIAEITKERLRRSAQRVREENSLFKGDVGFRVFKLDTSNIHMWDPNRDDIAETLDEAAEHLKTDRTGQDILFELLLKLGLDLTVPIETRKVAGKAVHSIGAGVLLACLAEKIDAKDVEPLALGVANWHKALAPAGESQIVFRDSAFADDVAKTNMTAILQQHGLETVRSL